MTGVQVYEGDGVRRHANYLDLIQQARDAINDYGDRVKFPTERDDDGIVEVYESLTECLDTNVQPFGLGVCVGMAVKRLQPFRERLRGASPEWALADKVYELLCRIDLTGYERP
jgi:hypothetical protein